MQAVQAVQLRCFSPLPPEVDYHVFKCFNARELNIVSRVASAWNDMANKDCFWRYLYHREFGTWIPKELKLLNWKKLYIAQTILWRQNPFISNLAKDSIGTYFGNEIWAICHKDGKLLIIRREDKRVLHALETGAVATQVTLMRQRGDHLLIGFGSGQVQIWNWKTGVQGNPLAGPTQKTSMGDQGKFFVILDQNTSSFRIIDIPTGEIIRVLSHQHCNQVQVQGNTVVSLSPESMRIWDFLKSAFCREILPWAGFGPMHNFLLHDNLIFVGSISGFISVWDSRTSEFLRVLVGHRDLIKVMEMENEILLTISEDDVLMLWDYKKGECIFSLSENSNGFETYNCTHIERHLLACGTTFGTISIWNIKTKQRLWSRTVPGHSVKSVVIQDGTVIAKVSGHGVLMWNFIDSLPKNLEYKSPSKEKCVVM